VTKRHRIAASLIVGDGEKTEDLIRVFSSLAPHVDGIYVGYTGGHGLDGVQELHKLLRDAGANRGVTLCVSEIPSGWTDDFAAARNQAFDVIPRDQYDWIIWIDSDDELRGGEKLQGVLGRLKPETQVVLLRYVYAFDHETGEVLTEHWRERMFRTDLTGHWKYPIHESFKVPTGTGLGSTHDVEVWHWRPTYSMASPDDQMRSRERNMRILNKAYNEDPDEPRHLLYLAHEVFAAGEVEKAMQLYELFVERHKTKPDNGLLYMANCRWAECLRIMGRWNEATDRDLQGVKIYPNNPEAYIGIAECCVNTKQYELAIEWANKALSCDEQDIALNPIDTRALATAPYAIMAYAYAGLQQWSKAASAFEMAGDKDRAEQASEQCAFDVSASDQREMRFGLSSHSGSRKSIAFVCRPLFEPWHPVIKAQRGAGGSESMVMELAQQYARVGWRVAVFGTPGEHRGVDEDGVEYWDIDRDWSPAERFDVVVASRAPEVFDAGINADLKVLWMHDVNVGPIAEGEFGNRFQRADHVVALTNWHKQHLLKLYPELERVSMPVIGNAVDYDLFSQPNPYQRDRHKLVYASSPDRGLDTLLEMWPEIKRRHPDATLDIFYGWQGIDRLIQANPSHPLARFRHTVGSMIEEYGADGSITHHQRVTREELARAYQTAGVWAYPTYFLETFCITALETGIAGLIPITSNLGGLRETVRCGYAIEGHPGNQTYRRHWLDALEHVINDAHTDELSYIQESNRQFAGKNFTWDTIFRRHWLPLTS
jgi:glycosyltransferase involved in cell wall biosynthesis/tetratricopeptide (TPR) repeat protein